ncbi:MAG: radical SAM family heme chaperone HemW, partial [Alphaproteobacteria bacterium]|nr:radical SAM family heme chaperone HemW [Alphaproteobacteria bacterium]
MSVSSIYVHWPFCKSKCPYCAFCSVPLRNELVKKVEHALIDDVKLSASTVEIGVIKTLYFGGGTPTLMSVDTVDKIINWLAQTYTFADDIEITLEANPATFDKQKAQDLKRIGVNRFSVGIQSFSDNNLRFLGRIYNAHQALTAAEVAAETFENVSFDFMYGYQNQTLQDIENDLRLAIDFGCKHISAYQLIFEENTPFGRKFQNGEIKGVNEDTEVTFYNFIGDFLQQHGIQRYEISNYAVPSFESRHNLAYWHYNDYLGVGAGGHSRITINGRKNEIVKHEDVENWINSVPEGAIAYTKELSDTEKAEEILLMGLRLTEGIPLSQL